MANPADGSALKQHPAIPAGKIRNADKAVGVILPELTGAVNFGRAWAKQSNAGRAAGLGQVGDAGIG